MAFYQRVNYMKLDDLFETVSHQKDFGNGRFVRNLLEKAELKQASRLIAYGVENLCEEDLTTFVAEDFETPQEMLVCQEPIGFFC
ncbi:hypothetical protein [Pseudolactococcus chungangensis]|jgi:hypothetical protein|uniref:hypothetical protein n=1 Tax=Pseudolactococcus chungangensis TaxID=451457 RepID=UPI003CA7FC42